MTCAGACTHDARIVRVTCPGCRPRPFLTTSTDTTSQHPAPTAPPYSAHPSLSTHDPVCASCTSPCAARDAPSAHPLSISTPPAPCATRDTPCATRDAPCAARDAPSARGPSPGIRTHTAARSVTNPAAATRRNTGPRVQQRRFTDDASLQDCPQRSVTESDNRTWILCLKVLDISVERHEPDSAGKPSHVTTGQSVSASQIVSLGGGGGGEGKVQERRG